MFQPRKNRMFFSILFTVATLLGCSGKSSETSPGEAKAKEPAAPAPAAVPSAAVTPPAPAAQEAAAKTAKTMANENKPSPSATDSSAAVTPPAPAAQEAAANPAAKPKAPSVELLRDLVRGKRRIEDFIDPARGVVYLAGGFDVDGKVNGGWRWCQGVVGKVRRELNQFDFLLEDDTPTEDIPECGKIGCTFHLDALVENFSFHLDPKLGLVLYEIHATEIGDMAEEFQEKMWVQIEKDSKRLENGRCDKK